MSKYDFLTHSECQNRILNFKIRFSDSFECPILFWHSHWVGNSCFDIQTSILTLAMSRKTFFWHSKSYFDIRYKSENPILTFNILYWNSLWVRKSYFDILNLILKFALSQKILFWHSKSYFHIRYESRNLIWYSKSYFDIRSESENPILMCKILFWHSLWVAKSYLNTQNPESHWVWKPYLEFAMSQKILFWHP